MDPEIVRAILRSSGKFMGNLTDEKDLDKLIENVPVIDQNTASALSTSLTDLLTFKVSPEAHQRYSVRMKVIETLREWIQPPLGLSSFSIFNQSDNLLEFCRRMMEKYFSNVNFDDITSSKDFFLFGRELINIANRNPLYIPYVKQFVEKLTDSNMSFNIDELVKSILNHQDKFQLEFPLIEKFYIVHCRKLIEEPLIDCFITRLNSENVELFMTINDFDKLINYTAKSPKIFQTISNILKQLFVHLKYSPLVLDYIQFVLKRIIINRDDDKKYILDLYPLNLQSCIILLNIDPCYHTENSKEILLKQLRSIYLENSHEILTLLTHFPDWLNPFLNYVPDLIENDE